MAGRSPSFPAKKKPPRCARHGGGGDGRGGRGRRLRTETNPVEVQPMGLRNWGNSMKYIEIY